MVTAACFTNLSISLFCCCCCCCFLLGHRYSVHIHYSFKNFKIQQGSTTLKSECQNWKERESALQRKDSRPTEQPNFLFVSGSQTSWLSDAGSLFHMSFMKCISISAIFWWLFFSDTVLLVLLWVLTKKRLMNIKGTNFTANHLQYTCYIQFLLAYLHIFFSSDLE